MKKVLLSRGLVCSENVTQGKMSLILFITGSIRQ